ncbi:UvrD-helicase domain-containing protein [Aeromicrobium sp.]|uniref:UvrD-helicase domain-containing protein n=1 Tax=Aeromicrobium sp. TaxID=1871063 RepID=UPI003D6B0A92
MQPFDLLGPLPTGTTVLEASAGTGKTYTVGALVTRYVAEGVATLDEMLVITFGRMASQELRERVREQLVEARRVLADPASAREVGGMLGHLAQGDDAAVAERCARITDALAGFDAATIATTHQFCQLVLRSLGVAGDTDSNVTLVEDLDELVVEVVGDLYIRQFGDHEEPPPFSAAAALTIGRAAVGDPQAHLAPSDADPTSVPGQRVSFAESVRTEVERRKQRLGLLSYDDLLSRLATALAAADAPARDRMRQRWSIVLVDEFQDTDPVQWDVLDRAFSDHATLVLIGDPKQAIYAFRGGDVVTYLGAAGTAGDARTLAVNHRADAPLVEALQVLTRGAQLGDERITVHPVGAQHRGSRLAGAPDPHPFRLRVVPGGDDGKAPPIAELRARIATDLADDVAGLIASGATFDDGIETRPVRPGDVAILMRTRTGVDLFRAALSARGIPSVVTGGDSVLLSPAADEWLTLLEALERQASKRVRAFALSSFVGETPASLDAGGEALADDVAEQVRHWLDLFRAQGVAAVHEAATATGLAERVLARPGGERHLTDLHHLGQMLHDVAHRERLGLPALLEWLRRERRRDRGSSERPRRLESDAAAVQILTIHGSKGLQYPVVYLPMHFDCYVRDEAVPLFHDGTVRMRHVGGEASSDVAAAVRAEVAAEELRLTYVALTRAQSRVVAWWAPSHNADKSGLTRLLLGRGPEHEGLVPQRIAVPSPGDVTGGFATWQTAGAVHLEQVGPMSDVTVAPTIPDSPALQISTLDRPIDTAWRRTSYSGLIRAERAAVVVAEPEEPGTVDEEPSEEEAPAAPEPESDTGAPMSPMADLTAGAAFGSLVHAVLEHADVTVPNLESELLGHVTEQLRWWPVDVPPADLARALVPMQHTSLGPLADGLRLSDLGSSERLCELDFELPLGGGDRSRARASVLGGVAEAMRQHLPDGDPLVAYADRLDTPSLGEQVLRGYLGGSIDVVLRVPDAGGHRHLVVDYKTNMLGDPEVPLTALDYTPERMAESMLHSHYPLQAMLYSVVVHRYLRWRLPDYDPDRHLGGVLYLYVRGMCGPDTPIVDGVPCGVFSWRPPAALVTDLSELLAGGRLEATP